MHNQLLPLTTVLRVYFVARNADLQLALICLVLALTTLRNFVSRSPTSGPGRRINCFFNSLLMRSRSRSCTSLAITASVFLMRRRCTACILSNISYMFGSLPCRFFIVMINDGMSRVQQLQCQTAFYTIRECVDDASVCLCVSMCVCLTVCSVRALSSEGLHLHFGVQNPS